MRSVRLLQGLACFGVLPLIFPVVLLCGSSAHAAGVLTVGEGAQAAHYSTADLLSRPDVRRLDLSGSSEPLGASVPAVPLSHLVTVSRQTSSSAGLAFAATDNFVAQISASVFSQAEKTGASAWIAIEDAPWPRRDGQDIGPFALVWTGHGADKINREQWVDHLAAITPARAVSLPAATGAVASRGRDVFALNCLPCHRLATVGYGTDGPDLAGTDPAALPLTADRLHHIVRNPQQVRAGARMEGFTAAQISDADVDALYAYLSPIRAAASALTRP